MLELKNIHYSVDAPEGRIEIQMKRFGTRKNNGTARWTTVWAESIGAKDATRTRA